MDLYLQPNLWSCLPTAFGMVLGLTPKEMFEAIGHDGSEIIWPGLDDPDCRRAFHPQECINVCLQQCRFPVQIDVEASSVPMGHDVTPYTIKEIDKERLLSIMETVSGVIIGIDHRNKAHAVAWNREQILDPTGHMYSIDEFDPHSFFGLY